MRSVSSQAACLPSNAAVVAPSDGRGRLRLDQFLALRTLHAARWAGPLFFVFFAACALGPIRSMPARGAMVLAPLAIVAAVTALAVSVVSMHPRLGPRAGRAALVALALTAGIGFLTHLALSGRADATTFIAMMAVGAGLFFKHRPEAYGMVALYSAGWLAIALQHGGEPGWVREGCVLLLADIFFVVAFESQRLGYRELLSQRNELLQRARMDELTRLPNRSAAIEGIERALARAERKADYEFGLCFLDIDRFKRVNDQHGHTTGDRVLCAVADRLRELCRKNDAPARLAGDELLVVLDDVASTEKLEQAVRRIREGLRLEVGDDVITVSAGGVWSGDGYRTAHDMLVAADAAMYEDKRRLSEPVAQSA